MVIATLVAHYLFRNFNFFKRHNVIHIPPIPILGVMTSFIFRRTSFVNFTQKIYNFNKNAKYIGIYAMTRPVLLLRDPELIKTVFVKNFDTFFINPAFVDVNDHVLRQNLFGLHNKKWREVKNLLSPFFTSGKMKSKFVLMTEYAVDFVKFMSTLPADKCDVNMTDVFDRYTNDVIVSCFYGIKIDSIRDPTNKFYTCGKDITHMSAIRTIMYIIIRSFPKLGRMLNIKLLNNQAINYFENNIKNEIATRDAEHITYSDMIQLMIDNRGKEGRVHLEMDDMIAQAYVFYFAGFETSSSVTSFIAYNLVANPMVQLQLRQEIDKVLDELNGNVTYEAVNQLEYLDAVIKEGLRLFSPSILERVCDRPYELPPALPGEKPFTMDKGMIVWAPIYAIHLDEKYYDDPEKFCPERFLDNKRNLPFYFPFGIGPRTCIGKRFGILMIKLVLFHLLARCELKQCAKTTSIRFSKKNLLMMPENGIWLNVQRRDDMHSALR